MTIVKSRDVLSWPEWQAFAARLGITERKITRLTLELDCEQVAKVQITRLLEDTCPPHPSDTAHTDQGGRMPSNHDQQASLDTTVIGDNSGGDS